ncbi:MAG TPA: 16S rRNA (guanine(966)-N(2))-methyltransferase RsmD [Vicinamibacterales bacterium]
MRIVAGEFRGRQLKSPTWDGLRPTSDRLRETLFNILGPAVRGARVLDGYAGTGAIGIEALSRGAAHVTFVEKDPRAVNLIEANLAALSASGAIIRAGFAEAAVRLAGQVFDLIILDPPYADTAVAEALGAAHTVTGQGTRVVVEHGTRHAAPPEHAGLRWTRTVNAGDSALSFYEHL